MSLLNKFKVFLLKRKFARDNLRIAEGIDKAQLSQIVSDHVVQGWEMTDCYTDLETASEKWQAKLRKGNSVLHCAWDCQKEASIYGPQRIMNGLKEQYPLELQDSPS